MWERTLSQKLVRLFCEQKVVDESKADAYVYGYELLISSVVSVLLVVLIAVVCGDVRYALSFLIGFIPERIYIGGYHATSHTRCYLAFIPAHTFHFRISDPFLPLHRTSSPL